MTTWHGAYAQARGLTERQKAILSAIADHVAEHGYPPTVREIGAAVGLSSTDSVRRQLLTLEALGKIRRDEKRPRAVVIVTDGESG